MVKKRTRRIIGFVLLGLLAAALLIGFGWYYDCMLATKDFDELPDYHIEWFYDGIESYQEHMQNGEVAHYEPLGPIKNAAQARRAARKLWMEHYDKTIFSDRPYQVHYSATEKVWWVCGSLPFEPLLTYDGGCANLAIKEETGEVLGIWHGK